MLLWVWGQGQEWERDSPDQAREKAGERAHLERAKERAGERAHQANKAGAGVIPLHLHKTYQFLKLPLPLEQPQYLLL